jgi:hypothetical protein
MKAIDAIRIALKFSDMAMTHLVSMHDAPLLRPGAWGGNHAMWIAGHLAVCEGRSARVGCNRSCTAGPIRWATASRCSIGGASRSMTPLRIRRSRK